MKTTFLKSIGGTALALLVLVGGQQISVSAGSKFRFGKKKDEGHKPSLVGVWVTQVTRRNCETGEPIGGQQVQFTFAKGGTLLETIGPSIVRSHGNGIWKREHGGTSIPTSYVSCDTMRPAFVGSGVVRGAIRLDENGNHYTATATNDVLDVNGNVISSGCATSVSTRFSRNKSAGGAGCRDRVFGPAQ